jgi:hypothetical protein
MLLHLFILCLLFTFLKAFSIPESFCIFQSCNCLDDSFFLLSATHEFKIYRINTSNIFDIQLYLSTLSEDIKSTEFIIQKYKLLCIYNFNKIFKSQGDLSYINLGNNYCDTKKCLLYNKSIMHTYILINDIQNTFKIQPFKNIN